ncbi:adenine methyltransferase [Pasteurellaceae bacterium HPA106]|uniref:DNA N-6-adenine-methyltransferase n=1 Tax=Spirabiliibacterium pneumoniae TaxID=221400 RepID=UPI001AACDC92|nr:DNA N-6-adenine-methyltransferase [Spirabiliibacterium pneumoniae]MBE2895727.1 adenine methyltransferase [Spirabiliibacterium pneumoniae]
METKFDRDTYQTPDFIFEKINQEFNFTIDGAAMPHNARLSRFVSPEMNFLEYPLENERVWVNPPYSKPEPFVNRAIELFEKHNCLVVMLLPVDISTGWFSSIFNKATEIRFIHGGRIKFFNPQSKKWTDVCRGNHLAIFNPKHIGMTQSIRSIDINSFGQLAWRAK